MPEEMERKFLVADDSWRAAADDGRSLRQAYLARTDALVVRVRIADGREATLTIKSATAGRTRQEFEYSVPLEDARALTALAPGRVIEKHRQVVPATPGRWEIDVFEGELAGLSGREER